MSRRRLADLALSVTPLALAACAAAPKAVAPFDGLENADHLIRPGETHFARLWKVTAGGENAEAYWSFAGDRLVLQRTPPDGECDRIYVVENGELVPVSNGRGVTTCSYFLPGDREVLFGSTQAGHESCPPRPDISEGYVWPIHPEYDVWVHDLKTGAERRLISDWGYDAEATVSPTGDRIVFTSTRSGDLELWTCDLDGGDLLQVTDSLGYDGGAFFSHDGKQLVFRATKFTPPGSEVGTEAQYVELLAQDKIRPHALEIFVCDADGSNRRQVTSLGGANWAPYFFPDDQRVLFSSNHGDPGKRNFDIWACDLDGGNLERITHEVTFDSFPMFSPGGRYLAFSSNRGGAPGETNVYIAAWK